MHLSALASEGRIFSPFLCPSHRVLGLVVALLWPCTVPGSRQLGEPASRVEDDTQGASPNFFPIPSVTVCSQPLPLGISGVSQVPR
jgi:hypothetical protein